jgi:hypothetical protein
MQNVETDLEQLEMYLDGALEPAELTALEARLKSEQSLAQTLTELKAQRALRAAVWQSIEPDSAAADRLTWRIRGAMLQQQQQQQQQQEKTVAQPTRGWNPWRFASVGSAAAACLLLGFMFGRVGPLHNAGVGPEISPVRNGIAISNPTPSVPDQVRPAVDVVPHEVVVQGNNVPIYNEYGKLVTMQKFDSHDEAVQFARDLHGTHVETSAPAISGPSRVVTEEH